MNDPKIIRPPMRSLPPGKRDIRGNADFITRFVCDLFRSAAGRIVTVSRRGHAWRAFARFTPTLTLLRFKCSLVPRKQGREF